MANTIKQVTVNGSKFNLGSIEEAAIKGVEQGNNVFDNANVMKSTLQVQGLSHTTAYGTDSGSIIADSTAALSLSGSTAFGRTFICALDGAAKTVNFPPNVGVADIGKQFKIVQGPSLVGSGVLTLSTHTGNTLSENSWSSGTLVDQFKPASHLNNTITITGNATNSAFGAGSTVTATVVAAGKYRTEIQCIPLGAGFDAIAYTTT